MKEYASSHPVIRPEATPSHCGNSVGHYGRVLQVLRTLGLWAAIGCTAFGLVSLFTPEPTWSLLYLVGFPVLCMILFAF